MNIFKVGVASLATMAILSACAEAPAEIQTPPVNVKFASKDSARVKGLEGTAIRTYQKVKSEDGKSEDSQELKGVKCVVDDPRFSVTFTTPAIVNLPDWGANTGAFAVMCEYNGKRVFETITAYNKTASNTQNSASQAGAAAGGIAGAFAGALVGGIVAATQDPEKADWGYESPIRIYFPAEGAAAE